VARDHRGPVDSCLLLVGGNGQVRASVAVGVDGDTVVDSVDLFAAIVTHRPGSVVDIEFTRDGEARTAQATLAGIDR